MKRNNNYILRELAGVPYILPVGQNIADHKRGIRLNESGLFLWNALQSNTSEDELVTLLARRYQAEDAMLPVIREDIHQFLLQLAALGILTTGVPTPPDTPDSCFQIGPLTLGYHGPRELLHPSFEAFACPCRIPDQTIRIIPAAPKARATGEILVRTDEITICKNDAEYLFLYPAGYGICECRLSRDGSLADFYCPRPFDSELTEKLFHAIRFPFLVKAQMQGLFALHSASLLYRDRAWLFSGSSGAGKSTHTALWNRLFGTPLLNGDLNLIGFTGGVPVVYGIPWCGTSGIYTSRTYPLGGVTLLKKYPLNRQYLLSADEQQLHVMHRLISPSWTGEMVCRNLDFSARLQSAVPILEFQCTMEDTAAHIMKQILDHASTDTNEVSQ